LEDFGISVNPIAHCESEGAGFPDALSPAHTALYYRLSLVDFGTHSSMINNTLKRKLGWLEAMLFISGVALMTVFFHARASSEAQRAEGVQAFLDAESSQVQLQNRHNGQILLAAIKSPDQELWSEKRVIDYEESLKAASDLPQAVLTIEKLNIQVPVYNGADEFNLNRGVARIKGTAVVDGPGNLGIAGHRDGFFRALKDIAIGDNIELRTTQGQVNYSVASIKIVDPADVSVLAPTTNSTMTLVTCYPFYYVGHAPKRYIVKAEAEHLLATN
jgi:sortase A